MTSLRDAAQQSTHSAECYRRHHECAVAEVERLRAALAEPVQESVRGDMRRCPRCWESMFPPQRKPLTEEEIKACEQQAMVNGALPHEQRVFFARAIEQAHGIE